MACLQFTPLAQCFEDIDCKGPERCRDSICTPLHAPTDGGPPSDSGPVDTPPVPRCGGSCAADADCLQPGCPAARCQRGQCETQDRWQTLTFTRSGVLKADLLFIIDNSGSMKEEQQKLAANFNAFLQELTLEGGADIQIGVITSDMDNPSDSGKLQGSPLLIRTQQLSRIAAVEAFKKNINAGILGTSFEKHLDAMRAALSPNLLAGFNKGLLRDGAILGIIFVTDEDDCSHNGAIPENEVDSSVCRLPKAQVLKDDLGNVIPDSKGQPIHGHLENLKPISGYVEFLKSLQRPVVVTGLIGSPIIFQDANQGTPIDPKGCTEDRQCTNAGQQGGKCIYNSPTTQRCGGCKSLDANAVPAFRIYDLIKTLGDDQFFPICGDSQRFRSALFRQAALIKSYHQTVFLPSIPLATSLDQLQVGLRPVGQSRFVPVAQAKPQNPTLNCQQDADCGSSSVCGPHKTCLGNGWLYTNINQTPRLRLSGLPRTEFRPGAVLRVSYREN